MAAQIRKDDQSSDSSLSDRDDNDWEDAEPDEEQIQVIGLFDDVVFSNAQTMLGYCKEKYDFDFVAVQKQHNLDFLQSIKLVNYIRAAVKEGNTKPDVSSIDLYADDKYLQPVLEDDALLFSLDDLASNDEVEGQSTVATEQSPEARIADLEAQLSTLSTHFDDFRAQVDQTLERRWTETAGGATIAESSADAKDWNPDPSYFEGYSYNAIHEEMLKDAVRTDAYRDFIYDNKHLFAGKTVLDVGCGTGILSMFCAKAGAARVIAVDNSDIIDKARTNIFANKLDGTITCLRGKVEEINLPVDKVDIIVSEWMGYCLLFEAMLDSVIWARDRYLKPDGLMVPSHTVLHLAPFSDENFIADNIDFWRDVYGFDMTAMQEKICEDMLIRQMPSKAVAGPSFPFATLDLHRVKTEDLVFVKDFNVSLIEDTNSLDGWLIYFDTFFLTSRDTPLPDGARAENWSTTNGATGNAFTTGPQGKATHWQSGVMVIERSKSGAQQPLKKDSKIRGKITYRKAKENVRGLEVDLEWELDSEAKAGSTVTKQTWLLK